MGFSSAALLIILLVLASPALAPPLSFPDVPAAHPYHGAVLDLAGRSIIGGYANGNFGPDDPLTRQQFAKMIVLTVGLPVSDGDQCSFSDVDKSEPGALYPDHFVAVAAAHDITVGTSPGLFSPDAGASLAQVVTMVVRAAKNVAPTALATPPIGYQGTLGNFDTTHGANMLTAEYNGLLAGGTCRPGFDPYICATRGEAAQVLHNLLEKLPEPTTTTTTVPSTTTTTTTVMP